MRQPSLSVLLAAGILVVAALPYFSMSEGF
jgi:hypothetical protein